MRTRLTQPFAARLGGMGRAIVHFSVWPTACALLQNQGQRGLPSHAQIIPYGAPIAPVLKEALQACVVCGHVQHQRHQLIAPCAHPVMERSEEHTSELQSLMRISYAVFCLKKKKTTQR